MKKAKKIMKFFITSIILFTIIIGALYGYAYFSPKLDIVSTNQLYIYDDNSNLIYQGSGNNEWVSLNEIADDLVNAVISTEDKNFYHHNGFDYFRIAKAMLTNVKSGKITQGASTISQQYIKNMYLEFDKTWKRKFEEALLTLKLEVHYSKDEILEGYLNTINFGQGNYGIENASEYYFNKKASNLTLEEAIILAGIPKSPNYYNPVSNYEASIKRAKIIAKAMLKNKYISEETYNNLFRKSIKIYGQKNENDLKMIMYYQDAVYNELESIETIPKSLIESGGLKIYTSLNVEAQRKMEENIQKYMADSGELQVASLIINPKTGGIMALTGGTDYAKSQFNRAISAKRQVGSSIKPLLYYSALENGMVSSSTFLSEPTTFVFSSNKTYAPANYNNKYGNKNITMAAAIAYSDNIYAVKTHLFLGEETLVNTAKRMGIKQQLKAIPSLALGTCELSMLDFARAYTNLVSSGNKNELTFKKKVEDLNGNILYEKKEKKDLVLNESYTYILNELMTATYSNSFIEYNTPTVMSISSKITKKYAIKTGSSGTDCWMVGYNPDALMMVWNGYDDSKELKVSDGAISKNIWADTMESILKESNWYETPSNIVGVPLDPVTGAKPKDDKYFMYYYVSGSEYNNQNTEFVYKEKTAN